MAFNGILFLFVFLPIALLLYYISGERIKEYVLFALSIVFYTFGAIQYIWLLLIMVVLTVAAGRILSSVSALWVRRLLLAAGVIANIGMLFRYKILIAVMDPAFAPLFPLGISFYTFKAVSYLADVYKGEITLNGTPIVHDALYLSFFAQIQSGPLTRYKSMVSSPSMSRFSDGAYRFLTGFGKKVLLADVLSHITTEVFAAPSSSFTPAYAWLGSICYSLQLFYDFSGYSDMAIGISKMFGYDCVENFNYPYMTESVSRFWRRWHISLSEWFRDYVYIPLGGSRGKSPLRVYVNLFIVWLLTGLWHGLSWNFIVWGLGYFVMISFERMTGFPGKIRSGFLKGLYRIFVLFFINCQWIMFRSSGMRNGFEFIKHLFVPGNAALTDRRVFFLISNYGVFIAAAIILCFPAADAVRKKLSSNAAADTVYQCLHALLVIGIFITALAFVVAGGNNPFVYANF
ncbi:MAG: MBOAT family protein [Lachnospiraceae bacterium]|nr:MBOAT family protein [Lachnospiraceae bacterium]